MNKQVPIAKVVLLIDRTYSLLQLSNELSSYGNQAKVLFVEPQTGLGFFQWTLPGENWKPFGDLDEAMKRTVAVVYKQRMDVLRNALQGSPLCDAVLTVPSESEFVFFRQNDGDWEIAMTAWGYQFVNIPPTGEISAWVEQEVYQEVSIGFQWEGVLQPNVSFLLKETLRTTSDDGFYHVDNPVKVGESFVLNVFDRFQFTVVVEKGKSEYVFDITQYLTVEIVATRDGLPLADQLCDISFNGLEYQLTTDKAGQATVEMPLARNVDGSVMNPQSDCVATCAEETQKKTPLTDGDTLRFDFAFFTQKYVEVKVSVTKDGAAMADQPCNLSFNGSDYQLKTDASGLASIKMPLAVDKDGKTKDLQPECMAVCESEIQKATPSANAETLSFDFVFVTPPEPKFVKIRLLDYGGYPLPELPFKLTTKKMGEKELRTDENGYCQVPQEWFSNKEKMRIKFVVSPEYQESHDIHLKKK